LIYLVIVFSHIGYNVFGYGFVAEKSARICPHRNQPC